MTCISRVFLVPVLVVIVVSAYSVPEYEDVTTRFEQIFTEDSIEEIVRARAAWPVNAGHKHTSVLNRRVNNTFQNEIEKKIPVNNLNRDVNSVDEFWEKRIALADSEIHRVLATRMPLNEKEIAANSIVLSKKFMEFDKALNATEMFPPSISFFQAKSLIEQSEIFEIIRIMPKGGTLFSILVASVPLEFMYNLTYVENLYFLYEDTLQFKYSRTPPAPGWRLLSEVRDTSNSSTIGDIDAEIKSQLNIIPEDPEPSYGKPTFRELLHTYSNLTSYKPNLEKTFNEALEVLYEDNVMYADFYYNFPEVYDLNEKIYSPLEVLNTFKTILDKFILTHEDFVGVRFIYAPLEALTEENIGEFRRTATNLRRSNPELVAGFGVVVMEENEQPYSHWVEEFLKFPKEMKLFLDAGVTNNWGINADNNLLDAVVLNTATLGAGVALNKHPVVLEKLREKNIPVKCSPTTSQVFGLAPDLRAHSLALLVATDFPITFANVGGTAWNATGLSYDWYEAYLAMTPRFCDLRCLKQFAINSLLHSNLSNEEKKRGIRLWQRKWDEFIDFVIENYTI